MHNLYEQAIATANAAGDDWALAVALNNSIFEPSVHAHPERSLRRLEQAFDAVSRTEDLFMIAIISNNIAEESLNHGDHERAETMSIEALELARRIRLRGMISSALVVQAFISLERGDVDRARTQLAEAIQTSEHYEPEPSALLLAAVAAFAAASSYPVLAAQFWGASERARQSIALHEPPTLARLRSQWQPVAETQLADQAAWRQAWNQGAELTIDSALTLALPTVATSLPR